MRLSASTFAKQAGVSLPTVNKWIKKGRITAEKTPSGGYLIDPAELDRVREHVETVKGGQTQSITKPQTPVSGGDDTPETLLELATLRERCSQLAERLAEAQDDKKSLQRQLDEQISELRAVRLLVDASAKRQAATPAPVQPPEEKTPATGRGFWSLFGRGKASA